MRRAVAAVTLLVTGTVLLPEAAARAQAQECARRGIWQQCIVELPVPVESSQPSGGGHGGGGSGGGSGGPAPRPVCPWVTVPAGPQTEANLRRLFPDAPPGAVLQVRDCADANPNNPGGTQFGLGARWLPPGSPTGLEPPSPTAVALTLYARVKALMQAPVLATSPPAGAPAVVELPVFVEVVNWQDQIVDNECVLAVCVQMTATPALDFSPGEPQAPVIRCTPPGTRFDAAVSDATVQASAPGACAYAYRQRTGVANRPTEWAGQVTVRWSVSWTSNVGASGSFPELEFIAPTPRVVNEVQTVVADSG